MFSDLLKDAGLISELDGRSPNTRLMPAKKSLNSVVERLAARKSAEHRNNVRNRIVTENCSSSTDMVLMEPIDQTVKYVLLCFIFNSSDSCLKPC